MSAHMTGEDAMAGELAAIVGRVRGATPDGLSQGAHFVEALAKRLLGLQSHAPGTRTPSAPGQPPALITGALQRSITVDGPRADAGGWTVSVGPTIVYGRIQELGGRAGRGSYLPARPYMAPAWSALPPQLKSIMERVWEDAVH